MDIDSPAGKLTSRVVLRTIDGKVIVRPMAKYPGDIYWLRSGVWIALNAAGVQAWNAGEDVVSPKHGLCFNRNIAKLNFS
jgi:hypothetical protein